MRIEIDPSAGFCFGVERVIGDAASRLRAGEILYGLGEMVHNQAEQRRLGELGMKTITHGELSSMGSRKVLFRAHGEPPETYRLAREAGVEVIDGTCPIVIKLQERIRKTYREMDRGKEQLVIFGKPDHPETIGLMGQVGGDALVVTSPEDVSGIEPGKKVHLYAQTTMDPGQFRKVEQAIRVRLEKHFPGASEGMLPDLFRSHCTICGQMKNRKPKLTIFARSHQVILFVSGKHSSNGKMLFEHCLRTNPSTHWISGPGELEKRWFEGIHSVGISGATSTSTEQLQQVRDAVAGLVAT